MEANSDAHSLSFHSGDAQALTHGFEGGVLQKVFHGGRRFAEAVFELFADVLLIRFRGGGGDSRLGCSPEGCARRNPGLAWYGGRGRLLRPLVWRRRARASGSTCQNR